MALPYLQEVVKETLRLHPPAPFIIRQCDEDCNINGFNIMKGTRTLINVFAVMRDPDSWNEPDKFIPERFSNESFGHKQKEIKGQGFHYLPFGSGRRGCPGASLALNVVHATVGAMVQCFDWNVNKDGVVTNQVNTEEGLGFSICLAHPLICSPVPRCIYNVDMKV
ncbi:hypothetical protein IFM89_017572 [Coptis chinensis]|uniref:Cytochrome P450 n=1 Tax=Coptis chinensis TaxID=261450 RepID=A0A835HWC1_9MAGN|nr:hypothetical protein IFM89_017572 [Coptis chinensis]